MIVKPNDVDRVALERAMLAASAEPGRAEQLQEKLASGEPWDAVAQFAAHCAQDRALNLRPWETAPALLDEKDDDPRSASGVALLREMLRNGVSRYDPDPLAALAAARRAKASR
jgi:hypothetical protein